MQGELVVTLPPGWKLYGPGAVTEQNERHQLSVTKGGIDVSFYAAPSGNEYSDGSFTVVYDKANEEDAKSLVAAGSEAAEEVKSNFGTKAYEEVLAAWKARAKGQTFVWRANTERRASSKVNYGLGPLMLKRLKAKIGEARFARLLYWYMTEPVTETEQLLQRLGELTSGEDEEWFRLLLEGRL